MAASHNALGAYAFGEQFPHLVSTKLRDQALHFVGPLATAAASEDWVLPTLRAREECCRARCRGAERGPLRGFFHGLLFDREVLANSTDSSRAECSDAELVLRACERGGEAALSRLRGSFVVAVIDCGRDIAIVLRDPLGVASAFSDLRVL